MTWSEGVVDRNQDHFELRFGSAATGGWSSWKPVARVGRISEDRFTVELLVSEDDPDGRRIATAVRNEISFYLLEKGEPDPWAYAQYHCGTAANIYSDVHWSFLPA